MKKVLSVVLVLILLVSVTAPVWATGLNRSTQWDPNWNINFLERAIIIIPGLGRTLAL